MATTIDDTVAAVAEYVRLGYRAVRAQCGVPGLPGRVRRRPRRRSSTSPRKKRGRSKPSGAPRSTSTSCPQLFARLRREFGPDLHLLHDAHHRLTPIEAARLGKSLEPYHLFWLEDPGPGRAAGKLPADSTAHDDAAGRGRGVQRHPRLPPADSGAAHRLHPHHGRARGRHQPPAGRSRASPSCITSGPDRTAPPI